MKKDEVDFENLFHENYEAEVRDFYTSNILGLNKSHNTVSNYDLLKAYFKKVNFKELIATLGGLHLFPENQCHTIRLEAASKIACALEETGNKKIHRKQLKRVLKKALPTGSDIGIKEDPSENLFTENILFHGGNYVIYSGNSIEDTFVLNALFDTIFQNTDSFPSDFVSEIESSSIALLSISNEIAKRMNHTRNIDVVDTFGKDIHIPSDKTIQISKNAVIFSIQEIDHLFRVYGFDHSILNPFCLNPNNVSFNENDYQDDLFQFFPFIRIEDSLIVLSPGSIVSSIRNFIMKTAKIQSLHPLLFNTFQETLWTSVNKYLFNLEFLPLDVELPCFDEEIVFNEAVYTIDIDKLSYVQLLVGNGTKFVDFNRELSDAEKEFQRIVSKRDQQISAFLCADNKISEDNILFIKILCSMEGNFFFSFKRKKSKQLAIPVNELEIFSLLKSVSCLSFWKYAKAAEDITLNPINSFLDNFSHYYENNCSFHIPNREQNEVKPFINLLPGSSIKLKSKVIKDIDRHGARIGIPPKYTSVINYHEDKGIPIYVLDSPFNRDFDQLIEDYFQPIWVCPDLSYRDIDTHSNILFNFIETISYWIWQITPTLKNHLVPFGQNPISIEVSLEESSIWDSSEENKNDIESLELKFKWNTIDSNIQLSIPAAINSTLTKPNNLGERWLIDAILRAFGEMLEHNSLINTLNEEARLIILNKHAPIGLKKKMGIVNSGINASLDNRYVLKNRTIQNHDVEEQMDWLASTMSYKLKIQNNFASKKECTDICNLIVSKYFGKLKAKLSLFYWQDLLHYFINLNEAICHKRAYSYLTIPAIIECFSDIESFVNSEYENHFLIDSTALSIRNLIEIIAAEPHTGKKIINICDMDELVAVSNQLINWAMISDYIHQDVAEYKIHILKSGRIIAKPINFDDAVLPFKKSKFMELYESSKLNFGEHFVEDIPNIDEKIKDYDVPFKAEFGISYSEIAKLTAFLIDLGLELESSSPSIPLSELKKRIKEALNWDNELIEKSIDFFSLKNRENWETPPPEFNRNDIFPWKYNRRLSYVRKPLIIGSEPKNDPLVFWGIRHVEEASRYLIDLVFSGRYKINGEECSEEMKKFIGTAINESGTGFTHEVKTWFETNTDFKVDSEVPIGPNKTFHSEVNLGDIDVLAIDNDNCQIYSIECKCINFGRNASEMANEIERFLGNSKNKNSWTSKHLKRDEWVKTNIMSLIREYKLESKTYRVNSIFIISSDIMTKYVHATPLPMLCYSQLIRDGVSALSK